MSVWLDNLPSPPRQPGTEVPDRADVAIIGGGFSGLWTAYYLDLNSAAPLDIAVFEAKSCGWGASGRNGGWCSALYPVPFDSIAHEHGREAATRLASRLRSRVDSVGRTASELGISCGFAKGGTLALASSPAHVARLRTHLEHELPWADSASAPRWLNAAAVSDVVRTTTNYGAVFDPHCAALDPARLATGLADYLSANGVAIFEQQPVMETDGGVATADGQRTEAPIVLDCSEAYRVAVPHRSRIPLYSLVIATEPLNASVLDDIGLEQRPTFTDGRHLLIYGQRTEDGRLVFGGRGAPYHFGSRIRDRFDEAPRVYARLEATLRSMFPALDEASITHRWGGPLGVTRNWAPTVRFDARTGRGFCGGYAGDGVAFASLAGETLAELTLGLDTANTQLPFVSCEERLWEVEPLRWIGVNAGRSLAALADQMEARSGRPAIRLSKAMALLTNR